MTPRLQEILAASAEGMVEEGGVLGVEHVFLWILRDAASVPMAAMREAGVDTSRLREIIEAVLNSSTYSRSNGGVTNVTPPGPVTEAVVEVRATAQLTVSWA